MRSELHLVACGISEQHIDRFACICFSACLWMLIHTPATSLLLPCSVQAVPSSAVVTGGGGGGYVSRGGQGAYGGAGGRPRGGVAGR